MTLPKKGVGQFWATYSMYPDKKNIFLHHNWDFEFFCIFLNHYYTFFYWDSVFNCCGYSDIIEIAMRTDVSRDKMCRQMEDWKKNPKLKCAGWYLLNLISWVSRNNHDNIDGHNAYLYILRTCMKNMSVFPISSNERCILAP